VGVGTVDELLSLMKKLERIKGVIRVDRVAS
jgi:hypothetical protein